MIKFGKYGIDADNYQYIAGEVRNRQNAKDKTITEEYLHGTTYHSTVSEAIQSILRREQRETVGANEMSLYEAVKAFEDMHEKFKGCLETALKEHIEKTVVIDDD